jgi:hypothetical protein
MEANEVKEVGFLENGQPGNKSSNRLIFVIGNLWAMAFTTYIGFDRIAKDKLDLFELAIFFSGIVAVFWGGKVIQKKQELDKDKREMEIKGIQENIPKADG